MISCDRIKFIFYLRKEKQWSQTPSWFVRFNKLLSICWLSVHWWWRQRSRLLLWMNCGCVYSKIPTIYKITESFETFVYWFWLFKREVFLEIATDLMDDHFMVLRKCEFQISNWFWIFKKGLCGTFYCDSYMTHILIITKKPVEPV